MHVQVYLPQSPALRPYIECFYVLRREASDPLQAYLTFPSTAAALFLSVDTQVQLSPQLVELRPAAAPGLRSLLATHFDQPTLVSYQGATYEVNLYFKPLGLNAFLARDLLSYVPQAFNDFFPFDDYREALTHVLQIPDEGAMLRALEQYWLGKLRGFDHPYLPQVLQALAGEELRLSDLATELGVSLKTLNAQCKRHLTRSPSRYRRVLRFRRILNEWNQGGQGRLTDLSHAYAFFDQSHMIREFKALTGSAPRAFFQDLYRRTEGGIFWKFME